MSVYCFRRLCKASSKPICKAGVHSMQVRGKNYLTDRKKIPAEDPVFQLVATDLMQVDEPTPHIARFLPSLK